MNMAAVRSAPPSQLLLALELRGAGASMGSRVALLKEIRVPSLIIHGADDPLVPVEAGIDTAGHIPGAVLRMIPGMGHDLAEFVSTPLQFYVVRFLLGAFEAGFFPGVILYFTYWYPSVRRGQVIAVFMSGTSIVAIIAGPLCGAILKYLDGFSGLHGWQWLFLVQGLPAVFLGALVYFLLEDKPAQAGWLSKEEKALLDDRLQHDVKDVLTDHSATFGQMLQDPKVYVLSMVYFFLLGATYTMVFWLPTLIQSWGVKDLFLIGIYTAIPSAIGLIGMILIGRHSDSRHERRWHFAACVATAALGLFATSLFQGNLVGSILALSFATIGIASATPLLFALTSEYLSAGAVAGGLALISSLGNLGPSVSPSINGFIVRSTGDNIYSIYFVMALYLMSGALLLLAIQPARVSKEAPASA